MGTTRHLINLLVFMLAAITGILIFTRGFLLTRIAITNHTVSSDQHPSEYKRAIVLVIDALRFDFVQHQSHSSSHFHNKLPYVTELLKNRPRQTALFRFIADPPTTTMQRLKGLTTGGLPTFVDAGSNFASAEINEDNIIDQLVRHKRPVVFIGDDTWEGLFPGRFTRSFPFPSFNVQDLHTVDQGVIKHLLPEISKTDWSVLIGHFLGVDHCGHRYGPDHQAMADKLSEMNRVIKSVVEVMDNDTVLVILGDHGMTKTGDHGGDSESELHAALVLHTKRQDVWQDKQELTDISQIDLVPTLSLLLGIPIPYSNLGSLIPHILYNTKSLLPDESLIQALQSNQHQISNYLNHYNQVSNDLPKPDLAVLREMDNNLHTTHASSPADTQRLQVKYLEYMRKAKQMCQNVWAKFDNNLMTVGMLQVLFCIMLQISVISGIVIATNTSTIVCQGLLTSISLLLCYLAVPALYSMMIMIFSSLLILVYCSSIKAKLRQLTVCDVISILCVILLSLCSFSNSMLINEDRITYYLAQSVILANVVAHVISTLKSQHIKTKEKNLPYTYLKSLLTLPSTYLLVVLIFILNLSQYFRACREEQDWCEPSLLLKPLSSLSAELSSYKNSRFLFMSVPSAVVLVTSINVILRTRGNLNGYSPVTLFTKYGLNTMQILVIIHWAVNSSTVLPVWQRTWFARSVYILVLCAIATAFIKPLAVFMSDSKRSINGGSIPSMYRHLKELMNNSRSEEARPLVYGLSTVYSTVYLVFAAAITLYLMMLSGDGMSLSQCLLVIGALLYLDLHQLRSENQQDDTISVSAVVGWFLLCKYYFYSSGQQPTITNIRWDAAFHGFSQDHNNHVIPAILLFTSTFSSQLIFTLLLPMLMIVTESCQSFYQSLRLSSERSLTGIGEITLAQNQDITESKMRQLLSLYLTAHLVKSFASLCAAFILRRHLMVWKIFAPALIYEGASFIFVCTVCLVTYLLFVRVSMATQKFISNFELQHND